MTVAHVLIQDHESRVAEFHQLAYHRFFIMLLNDLSNPDPVFDAINYPVLHAFRYLFLNIQFCGCLGIQSSAIVAFLTQLRVPSPSPQSNARVCIFVVGAHFSSDFHCKAPSSYTSAKSECVC